MSESAALRASTPDSLRDKLGVCQWFHYEAYEDVERAAQLLAELGVRHVSPTTVP